MTIALTHPTYSSDVVLASLERAHSHFLPVDDEDERTSRVFIAIFDKVTFVVTRHRAGSYTLDRRVGEESDPREVNVWMKDWVAQLIEQAAAALKGSKFELVYAIAPPVLPTESWDVTDEGEWGEKKTYREEIYPVVVGMAKLLLKKSEEPKILEACGGDGELASMLSTAKTTYHLFELNVKAAERARTKIPTATIHNRSVTEMGEAELPLVDLALAVGALNHQVLSRKDADTALALMVKQLKPGGNLIITGLSAPHHSAKDLKEIGLHVTNRWDPSNQRPFYIAHRPLHSKAAGV